MNSKRWANNGCLSFRIKNKLKGIKVCNIYMHMRGGIIADQPNVKKITYMDRGS